MQALNIHAFAVCFRLEGSLVIDLTLFD